MTNETMSPKQRVMVASAIGIPDRVPIVPISRDPSMRHVGVTWDECLVDGEKYVSAQVVYQELLGLDAVWDLALVPVVDAAPGARMEIVGDNAPVLRNPCILTRQDLARMQPITNISEVPRTEHLLSIIRRLKEKASDDVPVIAWVSPPFRTACNLRGLESICLDMVDEPSFVAELSFA